MKNLRNQVQLIGRLGAEPEMKTFKSGTHKVSLSIATSETYKNKEGEFITETQWHQVVAWNATASYADKYLNKGTEIMVQGKLTHHSYEDKNGITRYVSEIVADQLLIISKNEKVEKAA